MSIMRVYSDERSNVTMERIQRETEDIEKKLINEIADMKFSFKKLWKIIELDAVVSYYNR